MQKERKKQLNLFSMSNQSITSPSNAGVGPAKNLMAYFSQDKGKQELKGDNRVIPESRGKRNVFGVQEKRAKNGTNEHSVQGTNSLLH